MKKFISKIIKFTIFPVLLFILTDAVINLLSEQKSLSNLIDAKVAALPINKYETNVIIAGDSRAERQIIPEIIKAKTGFNTINIAVSNGELVSTIETIKKEYIQSKCIFVISTSSFQINDGAIAAGYLSEKCFQKISIYEKISLYKNNIVGFTKMYGRLVNQTFSSFFFKDSYDQKAITNKGYLPVEGTIEKFKSKAEINNYINRHKYYKNFDNNNIRWRVFENSLTELNNLKSTSFIIQPPLSDYGKKSIKNSIIEKAESEYSKKLTNLKNNYKNIQFIDYYSKNIPALKDEMFYDLYHLNKNGGVIYSEMIAKLINEKVKNR
jgi:hypothetical protein